MSLVFFLSCGKLRAKGWLGNPPMAPGAGPPIRHLLPISPAPLLPALSGGDGVCFQPTALCDSAAKWALRPLSRRGRTPQEALSALVPLKSPLSQSMLRGHHRPGKAARGQQLLQLQTGRPQVAVSLGGGVRPPVSSPGLAPCLRDIRHKIGGRRGWLWPAGRHSAMESSCPHPQQALPSVPRGLWWWVWCHCPGWALCL